MTFTPTCPRIVKTAVNQTRPATIVQSTLINVRILIAAAPGTDSEDSRARTRSTSSRLSPRRRNLMPSKAAMTIKRTRNEDWAKLMLRSMNFGRYASNEIPNILYPPRGGFKPSRNIYFRLWRQQGPCFLEPRIVPDQFEKIGVDHSRDRRWSIAFNSSKLVHDLLNLRWHTHHAFQPF